MIEAAYWFTLGGVATFATLYLVGTYHQWRDEERRDREQEAAERRIAELPPLDDDWTPARWPIRKNVR